jgi:hypothetical protein
MRRVIRIEADGFDENMNYTGRVFSDQTSTLVTFE